jgi:predicted acylesterase/phospholipase RssA
MVQHLVLSGGLEKGLLQVGALAAMEDRGDFAVDDLVSVYGTSIGAVLGTMLCAGLSANAAANYMASRPIARDFEAACLDERSYPQKGVVSGMIFRLYFSNILRAINLAEDATMSDLYNYSCIDLHMFSVNMQGLALVDISASTHPDLPVWKAMHMSAALPGALEPAYYNGGIYVDGGLRRNFPMPECLARGVDQSTVLGIRAHGFCQSRAPPDPNGSLVSYVQSWFLATVVAFALPDECTDYGVPLIQLPWSTSASSRFSELLVLLESHDARRAMVEEGKLLTPI